MGERDNPDNSFFQSPLRQLLTTSHRHLTAIGFGAAVVVISLAGAYAIFGASSDRKLETDSNSNAHSQQLRVEDETNSDQTQKGQTMEQDTPEQEHPDVRSGDASNHSQSSTTVTVNGQQVPVPANGEVHRTIDNGNGQTRIDVNSSHSSTSSTGSGGSTSNSNSSSVQMNVTSESHSSSP